MIKSFFEDAKDAASKFIGKYKNKEFMEAVMTACVMVAQADGVIEPSEKQKIFGYARTNEHLSIFDAKDISEAFKKCTDSYDFDFDLGKQDSLSRLKKLTAKMDVEQRKCILMVSCVIGKADGVFDDKEKEVAREIREVLGIDEADFSI